MFNTYSVRRAVLLAFEMFANQEDFMDIVKKYSKGELRNEKTLKCFISLDGNLISLRKEVFTERHGSIKTSKSNLLILSAPINHQGETTYVHQI